MKPTTLARSVVGAVNRFLNVAASLFQDFAHLARHVRAVTFLIANQNLAETEKNFRATRRRRATPAIRSVARGINRRVHIFSSRERETTNQIVRIRRIDVLKRLTRSGWHPMTINIIVIGFSGDAR